MNTHILVIGHDDDAMPLLDAGYYGPFESIEDAQKYAQEWRRKHDLPCENTVPTSKENEAWTEKGYTFGIFELNNPPCVKKGEEEESKAMDDMYSEEMEV